ncbi:ABC transporter permease [Micromonospora arida]|uniref:ABC transporter permease n=1 Tax=Micromonospora arida TaxID=2203715 RepID=UPI003CEE37BA
MHKAGPVADGAGYAVVDVKRDLLEVLTHAEGAEVVDHALHGYVGRASGLAQADVQACAGAAGHGFLLTGYLNLSLDKMKYMKLYDGMIATPVRPFEIAVGELGWAMLRGSAYSAAFLGVMVALDLTSVGRALAALPAAVLVGFAFGALGMAISTFMRSWQDFDLMGSAQFTLFLFSGTFVPAQAYPTLLHWLVEVTPLYRSVHLIRGVALGGGGWVWVLDVLYLLAMVAIGLYVASRRMGRLLYR